MIIYRRLSGHRPEAIDLCQVEAVGKGLSRGLGAKTVHTNTAPFFVICIPTGGQARPINAHLIA